MRERQVQSSLLIESMFVLALLALFGVGLLMLFLWVARPAQAHDKWADGSEVPSWIRSSCCGPADAHLLSSSQVHELRDGIHIDGISTIVPYDKVLPSQDGKIWAFYPNNGDSNPPVYCFFFSGTI